jgi:hypothetical protein
MDIVVRRSIRSSKSTIGVLTIIGNNFTCFTLEDMDRGLNNKMPLQQIKMAKVFGKTAVPTGRYQVIIDQSVRFGCEMPLLLNVPDYGGVRIHSGNTAADTLGCLLLGKEHATDIVTSSRLAFSEFYPILKQAIDRKEAVFITIV